MAVVLPARTLVDSEGFTTEAQRIREDYPERTLTVDLRFSVLSVYL